MNLHSETWGRGRRLVFVHGFTQTGRTWRPIAERFPFLEGYQRDLSQREIARLDAGEAADWWQDAVRRWEASYAGFLPIRAIRTAS